MAIGKRTFSPNEAARGYIEDILDSGRVSYGTYSKKLEREFAALHGFPYGVLSNSGTSSLHVAVQALKELRGWPDGAEVIVPSLTFVATINVLLHNNLTPVLVDVGAADYNMDVDLIEPAITPDTVAIMPVHLFGKLANMRKIGRIAQRHSLSVIEDSCECVVVERWCDFIKSDVICYSFYMAHHVQAGVGGIGITYDTELATKMRSLVNHGMVCDTLDGLEFDPNRDFVFDSVGHSFRLTEFEAALALSQLPELSKNVRERYMLANKLTAALSEKVFPGMLQLPSGSIYEHSFMMYPIVVLVGDKLGLRQHLYEAGIGTREMLPLINQPVYKGMWETSDYPVAEWIGESGFYIGLHPSMTDEDIDTITEAIHDYFGTD